jgi:dTDP-4-amino-4,6-dideoxygalactose transaminase
MIPEIPLFKLNYDHREEDSMIKTLRSHWLSMGPNVEALESEFARRIGVKHALAVTNCTAALHLSLKILGIGKNDEVLVPSLTFVATVNAIKYVGATPVFVDISGYDDFSMDPEDLEKKITSKTRAMVVMHYGGFACNMNAISEISKKYNLFLVEDTAHAPCAFYRDRALGTFGDIGCFSFYANKNMTCAEGGILVTDNPALARKARLLRSHGMTAVSYDRAKGHASGYDVVDLGFNYRMDDIRAGLALVQLEKLENDMKQRRYIREYYVNCLSCIDEIIIPYEKHNYFASNHIFPIVLKQGGFNKRENIRRALAEDGIQTSVHYPAVHRFQIYKDVTMDLPKTEFVADHEITLPMYGELTELDIDRIAASLKKSLISINQT